MTQPHKRPDPEELLRRVNAEAERALRGKLTIFFGAAPGVGKTYAMLEAARTEQRAGRAVLVGIVETHGRADTAALLQGLDVLPRRTLQHRGVALEELDLDAALARKPGLILIDELAHSNERGARHDKRWQDVVELLDANVDVFSTLNVQHVESLNDVIAKITGVIVRETVPDSMLELAHEIKLVDLPPDALIERLQQGKVYVDAQAQRAIGNFFRKGNLIALRELALRHTAERVDAQMRDYRKAQGIEATWAASDQLLVAVSPSPHSARLVRATRRMAGALHARWCAVYVETPSARGLPTRAAAQLSENLHLAQQLGAEVVTLNAEDTSEALLSFARERNITKIIVGKPLFLRPWDRLRPSLMDRMMRGSGDIDVYVTAGDADPTVEKPAAPPAKAVSASGYVAALAVTAIASITAYELFGRERTADIIMVYLLGIMLHSARYSLWPSVLTALLSVSAFDFFFIPPYLTLSIDNLTHGVTFVVMFLLAVVISSQTQRIRNQALTAREREARTAVLYALSHDLTGARTLERVVEAAALHLERAFASVIAIFAPLADGKLQRMYATQQREREPARANDERDQSVSQWVWEHGQEAGLGTHTLPSSDALYLPLMASTGSVGVLSVRPARRDRFADLEQHRHLEAFGAQVALAMERVRLAKEAETARLEVETERLRSSLLSSVSHDLRTPLAVITGAASALSDHEVRLNEPQRDELALSIVEEAERLNRLIRNLLDMTRLESGAVRVTKDWMPLEEVVGAALHSLRARLAGHEVHVTLPTLPLVPMDAILIEQVLINLVENALKYGADPIEICAQPLAEGVLVIVRDHGPGIAEDQLLRVFDKFHRGTREGMPGGVGLGLAICRAIIEAHGGKIAAHNHVRRGLTGASFEFSLPIDGIPPLPPAPEPSEPAS